MSRIMGRPVVGWDADGVIYDWEGALRGFLVEHKGLDPAQLPVSDRWNIHEQWGMSRAEFLTHNHDAVDAGVLFAQGAPLPGTVDAMVRLQEAGCRQVLITARFFGRPAARGHKATRAWVDRHRLPLERVIFAKNKTAYPTHYMIEDNTENYDVLDASGCQAYLLTTTHNVAVAEPSYGPRRRVNSLAEFADAVLADLPHLPHLTPAEGR